MRRVKGQRHDRGGQRLAWYYGWSADKVAAWRYPPILTWAKFHFSRWWANVLLLLVSRDVEIYACMCHAHHPRCVGAYLLRLLVPSGLREKNQLEEGPLRLVLAVIERGQHHRPETSKKGVKGEGEEGVL